MQARTLRVKHWWQSLTIQGVIVSCLGIASTYITPEWSDRAAQCADVLGQGDIAQGIRQHSPTLILVIGALLSFIGKMRSGTVYTRPSWPGPTKIRTESRRREGGGS